jgi:hypothetical protein
MVETQVYHTVVANSKIAGAGLGLFAGEFIPAGSHVGEYGGLKLQRGREEAKELRDKKHDTHVKRLGSRMHGDFFDGRLTKKMPLSYYVDNGLVGPLINSKGKPRSKQKQEVNVKEVEYEQYWCHPYSPDDGIVTCQTFYVTLVDLQPGDEIITDYGNDYRSIHLTDTDDTVNKACKSCLHREQIGCNACKELKRTLVRELDLRRDNTEMFQARLEDMKKENKVRLNDMSQASQARAKAVQDGNRNRLSRQQSDKLRAETNALRKRVQEADTRGATQQAAMTALQTKLAIAEAAAESYDKVREVWEAANEDASDSLWDGELFFQLDNFVEMGREAVRMKERNAALLERRTRANRNEQRRKTSAQKQKAKLRVQMKEVEREDKRERKMEAQQKQKQEKKKGRVMKLQQKTIANLRKSSRTKATERRREQSRALQAANGECA